MEKFGKFCLGILIGIPLTLWGGLILKDLWFWFIVPTFGVDPITWVQGVGINLFAVWFLIKTPKQHDLPEDLLYLFIIRALFMGLMWGMAWAYHYFLF